MTSTIERFWIAFIIRFAFGFLFLFAALNIFKYGVDRFSTELAKPADETWVGDVEASLMTWFSEMEWLEEAVTFETASRDQLLSGFLYGIPFVMAGLSVCILTGVFLRPALRLGALVLVILGLGKYLQNDIATTAYDFFFAFMICLGLYIMSAPKKKGQAQDVASQDTSEALA